MDLVKELKETLYGCDHLIDQLTDKDLKVKITHYNINDCEEYVRPFDVITYSDLDYEIHVYCCDKVIIPKIDHDTDIIENLQSLKLFILKEYVYHNIKYFNIIDVNIDDYVVK
ncbi:hypothetical protein CHBEV_034 [Choristoneura biennis entomopoxvirus]|uniref:Uncharacterized protein n=1 Tax=Choristoneura biennis entomopoxvirus TaxID=10288 RepID=A0A916NXG4_CBEPV|nr:hypothetical protein CHBEV_034 [Choristoneura biennis entomopoxvirus]CCU55602.1 hypothetical protein CHBEV_034 [Choristoneura biennis entomopoxvirus]